MLTSTFYTIDCIEWMNQHCYELDVKAASYSVETTADGWYITELTTAA